MKSGWPRVIANFAITADGKISTRKLTPTGFTSSSDKRRLGEIRAQGDALLAGTRTVETDNMSMGLSALDLQKKRMARGLPAEPLRVMVSNRGKIDVTWKVFKKPDAAPLIIFSTAQMPAATKNKLAPRSDLWLFESKKVDLAEMLRILRKDYGVKTLVCEGGPTLFRALLEIGAVNTLHLTVAPLIFGGAKAPTLTGLSGEFLPRTLHGRLTKMETIGQECFLTYKIS